MRRPFADRLVLATAAIVVLMSAVFALLAIAPEEARRKFGFLLDALKFGAPPHGGTAPGIARIVMLIAGEENLREVTMFPMNQQAQDLMMGAPSEVSPKQLRELHIRVVKPD